MTGTLTTIAGPMYAGKTSHMLQRILWIKHQSKNVLVLKPNIDNRYSDDHIATHNQLSFPCVAMQHWSEVIDNYTLMPYNYDTVFLDEVQFMDTTDTLLHVNTILNRDVNVVAAGLDQDSKGYPFETTAMLLALSDEVIKIQAICTTCGKPATKTQRRQDATDNRVAVGSIGIYEPKCVEHWIAR